MTSLAFCLQACTPWELMSFVSSAQKRCAAGLLLQRQPTQKQMGDHLGCVPCRRMQEGRAARVGRIGLSWVNKVMPPPTIASLSGVGVLLNRRPWQSVLQAQSSAVDESQHVSATATEISTICFSQWTPYLAAVSLM